MTVKQQIKKCIEEVEDAKIVEGVFRKHVCVFCSNCDNTIEVCGGCVLGTFEGGCHGIRRELLGSSSGACSIHLPHRDFSEDDRLVLLIFLDFLYLSV